MLDYYYQDEAVEECFAYLEAKPENHPLIVAPTGSGKSHIIAKLCLRILEEESKVLVLSHVKEILLQDEEKLKDLLPKGMVGLYSAGAKRRERRRVTVAGIQSVYEKAYLFDSYEYVIVDEAHLIPPEGEGRYLTLLKQLEDVTLIGLTATPYRLGTGSSNRRPTYPSASPLRSNNLTWYRNINLLSIGYALRPHLRTA